VITVTVAQVRPRMETSWPNLQHEIQKNPMQGRDPVPPRIERTIETRETGFFFEIVVPYRVGTRAADVVTVKLGGHVDEFADCVTKMSMSIRTCKKVLRDVYKEK
jgi:hypothetical protein